MPSEGRQKKIMEKLNRAQKCSILGPQNLGSRGGPGPLGPPPGSAPGATTKPAYMCSHNIYYLLIPVFPWCTIYPAGRALTSDCFRKFYHGCLQWRIYIGKFWMCAPPGSNFFQYHAVFGKFWINRMLAPPWGVGAPSSGKS